MANQSELDLTYLNMARLWSRLSKATRKKVGCLIVKDGMIISDGFNGMPKGFNNDCEIFDPMHPMHPDRASLTTKPEVLHAESNAITKLAKSTQSSDGATMYATCSPCVECAKLIIQAGIIRIVFGEIYKNDLGLCLLVQGGIEALELA